MFFRKKQDPEVEEAINAINDLLGKHTFNYAPITVCSANDINGSLLFIKRQMKKEAKNGSLKARKVEQRFYEIVAKRSKKTVKDVKESTKEYTKKLEVSLIEPTSNKHGNREDITYNAKIQLKKEYLHVNKTNVKDKNDVSNERIPYTDIKRIHYETSSKFMGNNILVETEDQLKTFKHSDKNALKLFFDNFQEIMREYNH